MSGVIWVIWLSYHSLSSPATYQPQRVRLLSEKKKSPVWAYFPDNDRRSVHYPLHNSTVCGSVVCSRGGARYNDRTGNWRRCAVLTEGAGRESSVLLGFHLLLVQTTRYQPDFAPIRSSQTNLRVIHNFEKSATRRGLVMWHACDVTFVCNIRKTPRWKMAC